MKRILGLGLFLVVVSLPLLAAKNSQTFLLPSKVRVGDSTLPEGHCDVSWTDASGSQVQLTIKTEDKKTVTIPARVVEGKQLGGGVETVVSNGVTYLLAFHTAKATFVIQDPPKNLN
ncbi:MAG TPA: hypothetical protein VMS18_08720 [Candidatus Binatia bacterium]|nr:hypothetical protein [Candidatus Binatia bacterium]